MYLLYTNQNVNIYLDYKRNLLVQKWNKKYTDSEYVPVTRDLAIAIYQAKVFVKLLGINTQHTIEAKLQMLVLQKYPYNFPQA